MSVWSGSEMFVWGGFDNSSSHSNTGGRYNPGTDSWTDTSTTNAPTGRELHTAVWSGSEMIVWGGYHGGYPNIGGRYNPTTDSWVATSTTTPARRRHTDGGAGSEREVWVGVVYFCIGRSWSRGGI